MSIYKQINLGKIHLSFETFPKTAKEVSIVYRNGIHIMNIPELAGLVVVIYKSRVTIGIKRIVATCAS